MRKPDSLLHATEHDASETDRLALLAEICRHAEAYCARAEHCTYDVRHKLAQWEPRLSDEEIATILAHLYEHRFLDDRRYCCAYANERVRFHHWGKQKIRAALVARGLPKKDIRVALEQIDHTEYMRALDATLRAKAKASEFEQIRFLISRGFDYRDVQDLLRRPLRNE